MRAEIPMRMPLEFMPSRRRRSRGLLTVALALSGMVMASGCATMETVAAEPGVAFDLPLGKTALLAGGTARITFNQVTEDSRCPMDAVCLWARALIARESSVQDVAITPRTSTVVAGRTVPISGYPVLTTEDAELAKQEIPGVAQYALTLTGNAPVEFGDRRATALLTLTTASLADFTSIDVLSGRFFTPSEVLHSAPVIVLGHRLAQELAGGRDALWLIGRAIKVSGRKREVVGVLSPPQVGPEPDLAAFAPLRGGESLLEPSKEPRLPTLRLKARSIEAVDTLR